MMKTSVIFAILLALLATALAQGALPCPQTTSCTECLLVQGCAMCSIKNANGQSVFSCGLTDTITATCARENGLLLTATTGCPSNPVPSEVVPSPKLEVPSTQAAPTTSNTAPSTDVRSPDGTLPPASEPTTVKTPTVIDPKTPTVSNTAPSTDVRSPDGTLPPVTQNPTSNNVAPSEKAPVNSVPSDPKAPTVQSPDGTLPPIVKSPTSDTVAPSEKAPTVDVKSPTVQSPDGSLTPIVKSPTSDTVAPSEKAPTVDVKSPTTQSPDGTLTPIVKSPTSDNVAPTVDVKSPTADVKPPTVDVKSPTTDKTPVVEAPTEKAPTVDVKSPTADVKSPTIEKTPVVEAPTDKAPTVDVKSPTTDKTPTVDVKSPTTEKTPVVEAPIEKSPTDNTLTPIVKSPTTDVKPPVKAPESAPTKAPTTVDVPTICTSKSCDECLSDARCGFCSGTFTTSTGAQVSWGVCRTLEASLNGETFDQFCAREKGTGQASGKCNAASSPVASVPTVKEPTVAPSTTPNSNTDSVCAPRTTCDSCFEKAECGFCRFNDGEAVCRGETLTLNGETGPQFCKREGGTWFAEKSGLVDICVATKSLDKINSGAVTEADINTDLQSSNPLNGYVVVVTVVTQAAPKADGRASFQTFIDISGPSELSNTQKEAVCDAVSASLAKNLGITTDDIDCVLTLKPSVTTKRANVENTYVADLTVGGSSNNMAGSGAETVVASFAATLVALFVALF